MYDVGLDPSGLQPTCQPETITTGLEGNDYSCDFVTGLGCFLSPAVQHLEQPFWVRRELLQWLALDTRKHSANQPSCQTEFDNCYQRPILIESDERPAEVIF